MSTLAKKQAYSSAKKAKKPYTARRLYKSTKRTQRSAGMKYPGVGSRLDQRLVPRLAQQAVCLEEPLEG